MSDARDRIGEIVWWSHADVEAPVVTADKIIAIVREQIMSDEVISLAAVHLKRADASSEKMQTDDEWRQDAVDMLKEIFDAVFGEEVKND